MAPVSLLDQEPLLDPGRFILDTWVLNRRGNPQAGLEEGLDAERGGARLIGRR